MALATLSQLKSTWLSVEGTEHDARLTELLAQSVSRMNVIARQPLDGSRIVYERNTHSSHVNRLLVLPFTVPVQYVSADAKISYDDAVYSTVDGITTFVENGFTVLYRNQGFHNYINLRLTLDVGYDGVVNAVPPDLTNIACEMTAIEFHMTDYAGTGSRLGLSAINRSEAGTSGTTSFKNMDEVLRLRLRPYTRIA